MEPKESVEKSPKRRKVEDVWEGYCKELEEKGKQLNSVLEKERNQLNALLGRIKTSMKQDREALQSERKTWDEMADKLKHTQLPSCIRLNVGGKAFATSLSTLTSVKGTFFESMFGGESWLNRATPWCKSMDTPVVSLLLFCLWDLRSLASHS